MKKLSSVIKISLILFTTISILSSCEKQVDYAPQIQALTNSVNSLQAALNSSISALQKSRDSLSNALSLTNTNLSTTNTNVANLSKSLDSVKTALLGVNSKLSYLSLRIDTANTQIANLNAQLLISNSNIASINAQINIINTNISNFTISINLLNLEYNQLLTQLNSILSQLNNIPPFSLLNGLVAYFPFNGNANDSSGNGHNGVNSGATLTTDRFGSANSAFYFSGTNSINIPLTQTNISTYSVFAWFKSSIGGAIIGGRGSNGANGLTLALESASLSPTYLGQILWEADNNYGGIGQLTNTTYIDNNWHSVIGTFLSTAGNVIPSEFKIYIDGNLINSNNVNTSIPPSVAPINNNNTNILIGSHQIWPNSGFNGSIDEIRIYNRVLTQSEISYLATH
jgi:prefoldin subunit 5